MALHTLAVWRALRRLRLQPNQAADRLATPQVHKNTLLMSGPHHQKRLRQHHEGVYSLGKGTPNPQVELNLTTFY